VRYWDSSAIVPLLLREKETARVQKLMAEDPEVVTWWGTELECVSALSRLERRNPSVSAAVEEALGRLDALRSAWHEVQPVAPVREAARRLLRVHDLRAMDGLQLASAVVASENRPATMGFVCLDKRLARAARKEGFRVEEP
jgi:predicted nucleic acid-binding protein